MPTMPPEATRRIGSTVTVSGALAAGQHTPADATAGSLTLTLPVAPRYGASLSVEKTDATANTVVISGSIRGSAGTLSLGYQYETIEFRADAGGTWRPIVNHLPKSAVDAKVAALATSAASTYSPLLTPVSSYTWNSDGTPASETVGGVATTYTWNSDGTLHTETRAGVTRTYTYNSDGTLASVA